LPLKVNDWARPGGLFLETCRRPSVAGIDDVPWAGLVRPRVTTATQPIDEISRVAIEWLLDRIAGNDAPPRERVFSPRFIAGESCADIRVLA